MKVDDLKERIDFIDTCIDQFNGAVDKDVQIMDDNASQALKVFIQYLYAGYTLSSVNSVQGIQKITEKIMETPTLRDHVLAVTEQLKARIGDDSFTRLEKHISEYTLLPENSTWETVKEDSILALIPKAVLELKYPAKADVIGMLRNNRHQMYFCLTIMSGAKS
jgi:hypothetical protein